MIEVHAEFPQREVIQANAVVDNEEKTISEVIISAKPEITGVTASVDNETGIPYVDVTETGTGTEFSFDLAFHNLKGDKGEQGETGQNGQDGTNGTDGQDGFSPIATVEPIQGGAKITITDKDGTTTTNVYNGTDGQDGADGQSAEITGATATIDGNIGTPSVSVTAGGTALARSFAFAFSNLKGETGATGADGQDGTNAEITGVTASVDNNTGIPYVDVTMGGTSQARTFDFAFHNLKGSGGSGGVSDVRVNNTSVVTSGVANIDLTGYVQTSDLATVATTGSYNNLTDKPTIPTVYNSTITITQGGVTKGSFTLNQSSGDTIALDAGGGGTIDQTYDKTSENAQSGVAILGLLQAIYPVGAIFIGTTLTCPMSALFGTWELVAADRCLQGASACHGANTPIAASLPNITGLIVSKNGNNNLYSPFTTYSTISSNSALRLTAETSKIKSTSLASSTYNDMAYISFDASKSSTIYGNTSRVQPSAYVVNIWRREA